MAAGNNRAPAWMTLGFALGLGFAGIYLRTKSTVTVPEVPAAPTVLPNAPGRPMQVVPNLPHDATTLGEVELQFRTWGGYAIWQNNVTQFALWNASTDSYGDFYEVRRSSRLYYFRTLPREDWPLIDHGEVVRCPLWFAETREMHDTYYREHPDEKPGTPLWRSLGPRAPLLPPLEPELGKSAPVTPGQLPIMSPDEDR